MPSYIVNLFKHMCYIFIDMSSGRYRVCLCSVYLVIFTYTFILNLFLISSLVEHTLKYVLGQVIKISLQFVPQEKGKILSIRST